MTEFQFVQLVKEMRHLQNEYKRTGNMRVRNSLGLKENQVDAAIMTFEEERLKKQPTQTEIPTIYDVLPIKTK